jgi:hypothetical protein
MTDWQSVISGAAKEMQDALERNNTEYLHYLNNREGRNKPASARLLDAEYWPTEAAYTEACRRFSAIPGRLAEEIAAPALRWYWARELYWNQLGYLLEEIGRRLLACHPAEVADVLSRMPPALQCPICCEPLIFATREEFRGWTRQTAGENALTCARCRPVYA